MHKSVAFEWEKQSVLDTVSLQVMEGKKVFALFLLLSALVATAYTRSQVAINPKQPLSPEAVRDKPASLPPGISEHDVKSQGKVKIPRPEGALNHAM